MFVLALTAIEKMQTMKPELWLKIGIAVVAFVAAILIFRRIMRMNKIIAGVIVFVIVTVVFFSWVYNRNAPAVMTPVIEKIAPFFPSANSYTTKQKR
jgi:glucan phosphoethanolaminetransferase (alkaline phosphatase superfamily)